MADADEQNKDRYNKILVHLFNKHYKEGDSEVSFNRNEISPAAISEGVKPPSNLGDLVYYFRFRQPLPDEIKQKAPEGKQWIIRSGGRSVYKLVAIIPTFDIVPNKQKLAIKVPDSTPGIISRRSLCHSRTSQGWT